MTNANPIKPLLKRLQKAGYDPKYVRNIALPEWWEDSIALNPAGYQQAMIVISRNLRLDIDSLIDEEAPILSREVSGLKYKLKKSDSREKVEIATNIAVRAAQLAGCAISQPMLQLPASAGEIRCAILNNGNDRVGFAELLDYCWSLGIPVLHVSEFPAGAGKPDALVVIAENRSVIALCKRTQNSAWLLFHLAHELGHIALGHLQGAILLVDEEVNSDVDFEEMEANRFAVEMLTGFQHRSYDYGSVNSQQLARIAQAVGQDSEVDAGFIALSHGRMTGFWGAVGGALKALEPNPVALSLMRSQIQKRLDWQKLSCDNIDFLKRILGMDEGE